MRIRFNRSSAALFVFGLFITAGCVGDGQAPPKLTTQYPTKLIQNTVDEEIRLKGADFPDCTIVLPPTTGPGLERFSPIVEETLVRHISRKMNRVIDSAELTILSRRNTLDLNHTEDLKVLSAISGCDTFLRSRIVGPGKTYLVVWSQVEIGVEVTMQRANDDKILWRARHIADRSEGGIPFSPIGFVVDAYSSVKFTTNREIAISVIDDTIRAITSSIPNMRHLR